MKLVDILARELKEWPEVAKSLTQDNDSMISSYDTNSPEFDASLDLWTVTGYIPCSRFKAKLATDRKTAIVTRADWQAAKDKLEGKTVKKPNANKDGFIRHRGGKCPVEAGTLVNYRMRNGVSSRCSVKAELLSWSHEGESSDVMAWKLCPPSNQPANIEESSPVEPVAPAECTNEDLWNCKYCRKTETCEALKDPRNLGEPQVKPIADPLQWRDRITEIDAESKAESERHNAAMTALDTERAELVQRLASEGLALIERKPEPVEDMSDWRNWKTGDYVEFIHDVEPGRDFTRGNIYTISRIAKGSQNQIMVSQDDDGDENGWKAEYFKWHSRPAN